MISKLNKITRKQIRDAAKPAELATREVGTARRAVRVWIKRARAAKGLLDAMDCMDAAIKEMREQTRNMSNAEKLELRDLFAALRESQDNLRALMLSA